MIEELKFLIDIVKQAEVISNKVFSVKTKGGEEDLVTNLDVEIEDFLITQIKKMYPTFDIVSEEKNNKQIPTENCFIIDPIDGTINFANNVPLWAIQIACVKNGKTIACVIDFPRINEFYYADESGAYLNGNKISVKEVPIKNALYSIDGKDTIKAMERMAKHSSNKRIFGGVCVSMAFTASGRIHGAAFRSDKPWDYTPGLFLIKMAGGEIIDVQGFHAGAMNKEFLNILKTETSKKVRKRNIFIIHSLNGDTIKFWGNDVKEYALNKEIDFYMPLFPIREKSSYIEFDKILSTYLEDGKLNENSIVIAHSIGNPYFIRFCREHNFIPKTYIAVAPGALYEYPQTRKDYVVKVKAQSYLKDKDFEFGKKLKDIYLFYSDEDDKNLEKFARFEKDFNAKSIYLKGYNHFDGYHRIYKIPELIDLLEKLI